jgi:uncharacterized protein (DUF58 family)
VPFDIVVENGKLLPLTWLRTQDALPKAIAPQEEDLLAPSHIPTEGLLTNIFSLHWFARVRRHYTLVFRRRGVYQAGPVRLESGDLFGFFDASRQLPDRERLTVFPHLIPFSTMHLPTDDPFGDLNSRRRLYEDPTVPVGVREYHPEDDFRRVHWPATAQTGTLQAKVYQPVSARVVVVCLNAATFRRHWEGTYPPLLEHVISAAATLVTRALEDGYRVGLVSNGCLTNSDQPFRIKPGRSPQQHACLLEALAGVTPLVTASFDRFLMREVPRLPYGATLMVLTAVTSPEITETMVRLRQHGRRITLIAFGQDPPQAIPGVRVVHSPFREGEAASPRDLSFRPGFSDD